MSASRGRPVLLRSGVLWYPADPHPQDVRFEDQRVLARLGRWGEHTRVRYTDAEHCVRVAWHLAAQGHPRAVIFQGLVHDGHEVYPPGDVPGPVLAGEGVEAVALRAMEQRALEAYRAALGLPFVFDPAVRHADLVLLRTEARDLMPACDPIHFAGLPDPLPTTIEPWTEAEAWSTWERMYRELGGVVL